MYLSAHELKENDLLVITFTSNYKPVITRTSYQSCFSQKPKCTKSIHLLSLEDVLPPISMYWPFTLLMSLFSCCDWSTFQDFLIEWLIDLWPILQLVLVLQEVLHLLSLLWSHCIHLGLENQYLHLDLGDPDTPADVISLTSDPFLAALISPVRNIILGLPPRLENLEHQRFPEIRESRKFFPEKPETD